MTDPDLRNILVAALVVTLCVTLSMGLWMLFVTWAMKL